MVCHWVCSSHCGDNSYRLRLHNPTVEDKKKLAPSSILREAKVAYYARNMFEAGRFVFRKGNVTSRHEPATLM